MKNVDDLVEEARSLADRGFARGEIADELNVSRETAAWLVDRAGATPVQTSGPGDIHVDWSAVGRDSARLGYIAAALADLLSKQGEDVDLTVGIEKAGGPLATTVATELDTDLATYTPRKHQWNEGGIEGLSGGFSRNFAKVRERDCYIVDDTITSGTSMAETIAAVRSHDGEPVACGVMADKAGVDEIEGVPVYSLVQLIRVGEE